MADLDLAAQYAQQDNPMFGLTPEASAAYLARLSDLMRPPLLPQGLPPASPAQTYQSPVELSGQFGTGQGPPSPPKIMFRKAFPISSNDQMDPGTDDEANEILRRQLLAQARGLPPGLPDAVLRSILQPDPTLMSPIADRGKDTVYHPQWYSDFASTSGNILTPAANPATTNADTVYYPPRDVEPVYPKEVRRNPNNRLRDSTFFQKTLGYSDPVWPTQQQLDYYMDPSGLGNYPYTMLNPFYPRLKP
jgi:hypothetical protein